MGAWFLGTFLFSIPAFFFYDPVLNGVGFVVGGGDRSASDRGPVGDPPGGLRCRHGRGDLSHRQAGQRERRPRLRRRRTVESVLILVGVVSLLAVVALRLTSGQPRVPTTLVDDRSRPGRPARTDPPGRSATLRRVGNGILLGYLMWRSRLLPRPMVMIGLVGGPLAVVAGIGVLTGAWDWFRAAGGADRPGGHLGALAQCVVVGQSFRPSPILTGAPTSSSA